MTRVPFTTTWIEEGRILAGSIPQLPEDLDVLQSMGILGIITLTRRNIMTYSGMTERFAKYGYRPNQYPIPDGGITSDEIMLAAAKNIAFNTTNPGTAQYIHCRGGIGRTGMILLAYYVLYRGLTLLQAKEIVKVRRNHQGNASAIDQGSPQKEWIDGLEARVKRD